MALPGVDGVVGALFSLTSDAVVLLSGDDVLAWNPAAEALFAVPAEEALQAGARPLGPALAVLQALPAHGQPTRVELASGVVVDAVRHRSGGVDVLLLRDVSETVRRERGLRRLAGLGPALLGGEPAVPAVLQELCAVARELTGAPYSAVMLTRPGAPDEATHFAYDAPRRLFPDRMPRPVGLLAAALAAGGPVRIAEVLGHPAGVGLPGVHPPLGPLVAAPIAAGEEVLGVVAASGPLGHPPFDELAESLLADLAAHAATAISWARAGERERERALVDREVLDTARHDLRTPVGAGRGFAALLRERRDRLTEEQRAAAMTGLVDAFDRVERFTGRLLADGAEAPRPSPVPLTVAALLADVVAQAGGEVAWSAEPGAPEVLLADPVLAPQAVLGFVRAALEQTGRVVLTVRAEGRAVRFDLRDEGAGLSESEQARLFEHGRSGLAALRGVVEAQGGTVGVSSRLGEGTTSWLTLPAAP